jgi:hypothetical protein
MSSRVKTRSFIYIILIFSLNYKKKFDKIRDNDFEF